MPTAELVFNALVGLVFLVFWVVAFVILYHLVRFGIGVQPKRFALAFLLGTVLLFFSSVVLYTRIDLNSLLQ